MESSDLVVPPAPAGDRQPAVEGARLFGVLPPGLFGVFHKSSRTDYASLILGLWRQFFADPLQDQPSGREVTAFIDRQLRARKACPDSQPSNGQGMYQNLVDAGWLTAYPDGYRTLVEMPEAVSRLVRFLSGSRHQLGGRRLGHALGAAGRPRQSRGACPVGPGHGAAVGVFPLALALPRGRPATPGRFHPRAEERG